MLDPWGFYSDRGFSKLMDDAAIVAEVLWNWGHRAFELSARGVTDIKKYLQLAEGYDMDWMQRNWIISCENNSIREKYRLL